MCLVEGGRMVLIGKVGEDQLGKFVSIHNKKGVINSCFLKYARLSIVHNIQDLFQDSQKTLTVPNTYIC